MSRFWYVETRGSKIAIEYFFLLYLPVNCGDFIEQKICLIHFKEHEIYNLLSWKLLLFDAYFTIPIQKVKL